MVKLLRSWKCNRILASQTFTLLTHLLYVASIIIFPHSIQTSLVDHLHIFESDQVSFPGICTLKVKQDWESLPLTFLTRSTNLWMSSPVDRSTISCNLEKKKLLGNPIIRSRLLTLGSLKLCKSDGWMEPPASTTRTTGTPSLPPSHLLATMSDNSSHVKRRASVIGQ